MKPWSLFAGVLAWLAFAFLALCLFVPKRAAAAGAVRKPAPEVDRIATLNVTAFLDAIAEVETGHNPRKLGLAGERGRCQFMLSTWVRHAPGGTFLSHATADTPFSRRVERAHVAYLVAKLFPNGGEIEPLLLAAAWRYGPGAATNHVRGDYARRVVNLYTEAVQ